VSFALMVISSGIASWSDLTSIFAATFGGADSALRKTTAGSLSGFNIGYFWMIANCFSSAGYVGLFISSLIHVLISTLAVDHAEKNQANGFQRLGYNVLQQLVANSPSCDLLFHHGGLEQGKPRSQLVSPPP